MCEIVSSIVDRDLHIDVEDNPNGNDENTSVRRPRNRS